VCTAVYTQTHTVQSVRVYTHTAVVL
jgi:hypothetical protein